MSYCGDTLIYLLASYMLWSRVGCLACRWWYPRSLSLLAIDIYTYIHHILYFFSSTSDFTMIIRFPTTDFTEHTACKCKARKLSRHKISQDIKRFKVQIKTTLSFPSRSLFLLHLTPTSTHQQQLQKQLPFSELFGKREKHWRRKRRILQWYRPYLSRLKQQSSLREQIAFIFILFFILFLIFWLL